MIDGHVSPRDIELLADNVVCMQIIADMRMRHGLSCPRCRSTEIHAASLQPSSGRIYPQFRCLSCGHNFAAIADTFAMGARMLVKQYLQVFVLHNALGEAFSKAAACRAVGIKSHDGIKHVLHRIAFADPGISFARVDPALSAALRRADENGDAERNSGDDYFDYCDRQSIVIDWAAFSRAVDLAVNRSMPELVKSYKERGRPYTPKRKPSVAPNVAADLRASEIQMSSDDSDGNIQNLRKLLAQRWLERFSRLMPGTSVKKRVSMAWHLAALGVDTDQQLAQLAERALMPTNMHKPTLVELRSQYLANLEAPVD